MLGSWLWILGMGFFVGQILGRLGMPPLVGMILVGILLQEVLSPELLAAAGDLRLVAVTIILMKAGLGLDREKLAQQGSVALRLGFLPAACEALAVALLSRWILGLDWATGLLLGCVIGAESPAVIVPGMLRLKSLGWGVAKGIPDAILTGSALSDVLLLLGFSLLLSFLGQGSPEGLRLFGLELSPLQWLPFQVGMEILLGVAIGYLGARLLVALLVQQNWTRNSTQEVLLAACLALGLVLASQVWPYFSGYPAVMALGFFLVQLDGPLARRLRLGFDALWTVAEIVLFVLLGASLDLQVLGSLLLPGLLLLTLSLLLGRGLGWWLSTVGSNWNWRERLFLLPGNMAKATVQAAIGGIPLAQGIPGGETILAIAALSILATAPLGAWLTQVFAPRLLEKGEVDPTKVGSQGKVSFLAAVDTSPLAEAVLRKAADLARRLDGEVIVLHVTDEPQGKRVEQLRQLAQRLLADIRHEFCLASGPLAETIVGLAQERQVTDIVMGKRGQRGWEQVLLGSTSQAVLETSPIPVILVEEEEFGKARIDTPTA
ncbi:solute carrier family 9B (sodium/hydrogen exchanger), member 1/2 [Thermostichus sp. OS-CIW-18]|jgi:NhaP-type Na+/H+ or K+/H+ antiporter/nucleotide-binding universal stress UspA family protein|uniref:cation:proton antiporter domain-containing protein n=1 Tax=unclassified Synechococcus TaxID=2626047 RepID=UPI000C18D51F|nr:MULTISPECIES: cation:proton antiporter [unclassified Synechococcus]PIK94881.1 sodium:proton antiporter [Synechococcus sp. 60AY4M2]PIL02155.1 sodium:proton antiporter [Synechococcus sp. 65AY640]